MKKIALVTGASRGIGLAIATILAEQGLTVIGTATTTAGANFITNKLLPFQGRGLLLDVNNTDNIKSVVDNINHNEGNVSILVNNAGITNDNLLLRMTSDQWDSVITTNLKSIFTLTKAVIPQMLKQRYGRIVNISSVIAQIGNAGQSNYAAAKAGMIAFTKSIAKEYGSKNITANCIAPGFIETDMTNDINGEIKTKMLNTIPLKKMGQPSDIAQGVLYLVSKSGDYITGSVLNINGGLY